jgi:uncharacterized protein YcnI
VVAAASAAAAHVKVSSESAAVEGGYATLVFTVPSEENANTVRLSVTLPGDAPIASVSTMPIPGWTVATTQRTLTTPITTDDGPVSTAISTITWTANAGAGIPPNSFQEFKVSAGPLPKVPTMAFPAVQTYSNGDTVRWIEPTPANGDEPDHPVPVLNLVASGSAAAATAPATTAPAASVSATAPSSRHDGTARGLGIAGIIVGALGLLPPRGPSAYAAAPPDRRISRPLIRPPTSAQGQPT